MCERERERKYYFSLLRALLRHMQNEGQKVRKRGEERTKKDHRRERKRENDGRKKLLGKQRRKTEQRKQEKTFPRCRRPAVADDSLNFPASLLCFPPSKEGDAVISILRLGRQAQREESTCSRSHGG